MLIRRAVLPIWCAAFAVAGAYSFTVQVADPASRASGQELRLSNPASSPGGSCAAAPGEPLGGALETQTVEHRVCVETLDCGSCCGNRATLRRFWACCNSGGGYGCESLCYPRKP